MDYRRRVHLFQVNYLFGQNAFFPYSVGMIRAYCESQPSLAERYKFEPLGYRRDAIDAAIGDLVHPDVVGLSCYVWNLEWNLRFAAAVRAAFPECLIVLGGPQAPRRSEQFFARYSFVDLLVHGEGELAFAEILAERLKQYPEYGRVPGLSIRSAGGVCVSTGPRHRLDDLGGLPSPYVAGVFDDILGATDRWNASQETNRGCPYSCTFCDWGSAVMTQVRHFPEERVREEIAWFGRRAIDIVYNCDANYGMFERDLALARIVAQTRERTGYPTQFRTSYAKKSNDTVFAIAQVLDRVGLERGIGISLQSSNRETLLAVQRSNLPSSSFGGLLARYRSAGIPTYTELILGLPGESRDSFVNGVCEVLESGQHESVLIYPCQVLPNSELADPAYVQFYGIRTVRTPLLLGYSTPAASDIPEFMDLVVETSSMPHADWIDAFLFGWVVQFFHCLNITQSVALVLRHSYRLSYREFYEALLAFAAHRKDSFLGTLRSEAVDSVRRSLSGDTAVKRLDGAGEVVWNPEEIAFLRAIVAREAVFNEIGNFLRHLSDLHGLRLGEEILSDLVTYQQSSLVAPSEPKELHVDLQHDIPATLQAARIGESLPLERRDVRVRLVSDIESGMDFEAFALEALRYGRKHNRLRRRVEDRPRESTKKADDVSRAFCEDDSQDVIE